MKNIYLLAAFQLILGLAAHAQLQIQAGGSISVNGSASIQLHNTGLVNNGAFSPGAGAIVFTGNAPAQNSMISGNGISVFHDLIIDKDAGGVMLDTHIVINNTLGFSQGSLNIDRFDVDLGTGGQLVGEHNFSRVVSDGGGVVKALREVKASTEEHFGNMGLHISSVADLGWCVVERGHEAVDIGSLQTIDRHYYFSPGVEEGHGIQIKSEYFEADIENHDKERLKLFQQIDSIWLEHGNHVHDTLSNAYYSDGIAAESVISLAHEDALMTSAARALEKRTVQLKIWPNPAATEVYFDLGDSFRKGQYAILRTATGQSISMMNVSEPGMKIERRGLPAGVYFLELREGARSLGMEKIIWK